VRTQSKVFARTRAFSCTVADSPVPLGKDWVEYVNQPQTKGELEAIRRCVKRGQPFGSEAWQQQAAKRMGLEHTFRRRGRPGKSEAPA
jgi:putative transposase